MQISCPSCGRRLHLDADRVGRSVMCPGCQREFVAESGSTEVQAARPRESFAPLPPLDEVRAPTERRPAWREENDDHDVEWRQREDAAAHRIANGAATWFFVAAVATLLLSAADIAKTFILDEFENLPFGAEAADFFLGIAIGVVVGCGLVLVVFNLLLFMAGVQLRSLSGKGLIITGIVLAFIQTFYFGGGALMEAVSCLMDLDGGLERWTPLSIGIDLVAGALNCLCGVRGVMALNNEAVRGVLGRRQQMATRMPPGRWED